MSSKMFTTQISDTTGVFNPQRYLEKFGYKVGSGLGKNEDGRASHIQVYKKEDAKGIGAHEDYTKSFETLFNQAASKTGVLKGGITFFDSDDEQDEKPTASSADVTDSKKRKKQSKSSSSSSSSGSDSDSEPRSKKAKNESAPVAPAPEAPAARTLPSSSIHFIKFNMGSKLLADSHAEVDLSGNKLRKGAQEEKGKKSKKEKKNKKEKKREVAVEEDEDDYDAPRGGLGLGARKAASSSSSSDSSSSDEEEDYQPEMKFISENKPRPAASSIPKAKENQTIKQGSIVKELNGHHLYHDRSQGKLKRLEEADRAFIQSMMNKQESTPVRPAAPKPTPQSSPISAANLSPSESSSSDDDNDDEEDKAAAEREKARKERKAAKKAKKEKKEKKEKKAKKDKKSE